MHDCIGLAERVKEVELGDSLAFGNWNTLKSELNSSDLAKTFRSMNMKSAAQAAELFEAVDGWGTDESAIHKILENPNNDLKAIAESYKRLFGESLESRMRSEMGGRDLNRALKALGALD